MKQIVTKYCKLNEMLEEESAIDDFTRDNLRKCLKIYINGEILLAFNEYVQKSEAVITADMIAFFYLHLQMSGAANEALSRGFTDLYPALRRVLFDETADGKGAARLPRFASAHSKSLAGLLNDFTPALLRDYMLELKEIMPALRKSIVSCVPALREGLSTPVEIKFMPMMVVAFSSPQFMINAQQANASCLLESVKAIDIITSILSPEHQKEFNNSHTAQALIIMARQIVANNIFELLKSGVMKNSVNFVALRKFRNCSAHGFVMWEIQNNPVQLWFNCRRLVLGARDILVGQLVVLSPTAYRNYLNPPSLELKVSGEPRLLIQNKEPTRAKKKPARSVVSRVQETDDCTFLVPYTKQAEQNRIIRNLTASLIAPDNCYEDLIVTLNRILTGLKPARAIAPDSFIYSINEPLIGIPKSITRGAADFCDEAVCSVQVDQQRSFRLSVEFSRGHNIGGLKEVKFYMIGLIFMRFADKLNLLDDTKNLQLFKKTLKQVFDFGASPNVTIQTIAGLIDILAFAIFKNFPVEIISLLLEHGANVDFIVRNRPYVNALTSAARSRPDIVPLLLHAGANPLDLIYDHNNLCKSSLFYDILVAGSSPIEARKLSLKILFPFVFQKYGEEALLAIINTPATIYPIGTKPIVSMVSKVYALAKSLPSRAQRLLNREPLKPGEMVQEDILPVTILHRKVETVLTNPRFNFYKLILNDEIGILLQEISMLKLPKAILAAMGITDSGEEAFEGERFTAADFAGEMGLMPLAAYLGRVRAFCQSPSVIRHNNIDGYFSLMETCLYNILGVNFSCKYASERSIFDIVIDYWGRGIECQNVAHYCL